MKMSGNALNTIAHMPADADTRPVVMRAAKFLSVWPLFPCRSGRRLAALCLACLALPVQAASPEIADWCAQLGKRLRSVEAPFCQRQDFAAAKLRSAQGRPLMIVDIPSVASRPKARPVRVFMIGGIHGDELTSVSIVFRWMNFLDEEAARIHHWRIVPLANPDGLFAQPSRRTNGHGVDLNRNFPTPDWSSDALAYWKRRAQEDPRRFPGNSPMSETETQWLCHEIETFKPDVIVSIHAPYGILDYDGPAPEPPRHFGRLNLNQLGVYPGSLGNFGGIFRNIPVITIELPHATAMPSPQEQRQIWDDMLSWIRRHIVTRRQKVKDGRP
jgi:hypothetical protein